MIIVFNFRLGQSSAASGTPVHRFFGADNGAGQKETVKLAGNSGLIAVLYGQVRIIPVTKHTEPPELGLLGLDPFLGILAAGFALCKSGNLFLFVAKFLIHIMLNGQTVAVPTWNIWSLKTSHTTGL